MIDEPDSEEPDITDDAAAGDTPAEDLSSRRAYTRKVNRIEQEAAEAAEFWKAVLALPVGRREVWKILAAAHPFEIKFACGPNGFPQAEATWVHLGEQQLGLRLFAFWQALDPQGVLAMQQEHDPRFKKPERPKRKRGA